MMHGGEKGNGLDDLIVIRVDGGICSQMGFVSVGRWLEMKFGDAVRVKYDLSWFRDCGRDIDGRFARNWDVGLAFPDLRIEEATPDEIASLKESHSCTETNVETFSAPMYVCGYPDWGPAEWMLRDWWRMHFRPALDSRTAAVRDELRAGRTCAVHVRRGDLAVFSNEYGYPTTADYFSNAVRIVAALRPGTVFYFFSDEVRYVKDVLLQEMPGDVVSRVVSGNGSDRGYLDMYLMSCCESIVSSVGSLGVVAALLSDRIGLFVSSRKRDLCFRNLERVVYLNDDGKYLSGIVPEKAERPARKCEFVLPGRTEPVCRKSGPWKLAYKIWKWLGKRLVVEETPA